MKSDIGDSALGGGNEQSAKDLRNTEQHRAHNKSEHQIKREKERVVTLAEYSSVIQRDLTVDTQLHAVASKVEKATHENNIDRSANCGGDVAEPHATSAPSQEIIPPSKKPNPSNDSSSVISESRSVISPTQLLISDTPRSNEMQSDAWLLESCQKTTDRIFKEIVNPWIITTQKTLNLFNTEKDKAEAEWKATSARIAETTSDDLKKIDDEKTEISSRTELIKSRFIGLGIHRLIASLVHEQAQVTKNPPTDKLSNHIISKCCSDFNHAYRNAEIVTEITQEQHVLIMSWLKSYGWWVFLGSWLITASITNSGTIGFILALLSTFGIPSYLVSQRFAMAEDRWRDLARATAIRQHWLHDRVREIAVREKEQQNTAEKNARMSIDAAKKVLALSQLNLEKTTEQLALDIKADIDGIYKAGLYKAATTRDKSTWETWSPFGDQVGVVRVGELNITLPSLLKGDQLLEQVTRNYRNFKLPVFASLRNGKSIYIRIENHTRLHQAYSFTQNIIFRILAFTPPAKVLFTFIDPIGQGQNAASFLSLADFDESLVNSKAWTDPRQIERKLTDLTEHMETVIQKFLRTDYATIDDYNKAAGEIAEAYRVVVVFDFPDSISENASRQLERIVQNGGRCGVYALIIHDTSKKPSYGVNEEKITKHSLVFRENNAVFKCDSHAYDYFDKVASLCLDESPPNELVKSVVQAIGEKSKSALKVEVPYPKLLLLAGIDSNKVWGESTAGGLRIPLGPGNARKPRFLELGVGLSIHALVVGRPGSGKSNLMHVVITTAARLYSPEDLHLYLIDFKEGVEFKPYAESSLPHARVIAIKSEREFGLSVLRALDDILKQRGELFRRLGVSSISDYRGLTGENGEKLRLPRILLLVDEFQEFFVKQDAISEEVAILFDRIVRQGRAFGMHMLLGSQTLANYSLPQSTLNLITVRIALQSSEADSRRILADDNTAARLLSRPGEGIYNASSGLVEGNNLFQVALFEDEHRQAALELITARLQEVRSESSIPAGQYPLPIVFEGHEPAILEKSTPIVAMLKAANRPEEKRAFEIWLGEPIAIKPPTSMKISKRSGSHLLVVTKNEEEAVGLLTAAIVSLVAQINPNASEISILDLTTADAEWADVPEHMEELFDTHKIRVLDRRGLQEVLAKLNTLVKERSEGGHKVDSSHYLILLGMHRARDLRQEGFSSSLDQDEDNKPNLAAQLATILRDGPECGVHVMAWCDSYANLNRIMDRRLIAEFGTRVVGQMSDSDSTGLIENAAASKIDRPHRLIKYDEEHIGVLEVFRPYALPSCAWLEHVGATLRNRH